MVEFLLPKQAVAGSSPVSRSLSTNRLFVGSSQAASWQADCEKESKGAALLCAKKACGDILFLCSCLILSMIFSLSLVAIGEVNALPVR